MSVNLNQSLYNTAEALGIHTRSIEISGQNMANVHNTEYAARKVRIASSAYMPASGHKGGTGGTIDISVVTERDALVDRQIVQSSMRSESLKTQVNINKSLESLLGERFQINAKGKVETGSDFGSVGFSNDINQFFNACNNLSAQSASKIAKSDVVTAAQNMVDQLHQLDSRLKRTDENLALSIQQNLNEINSLLGQIADQTKKILDFEVPRPNETALEIRENRQGSLEKLAKLIDFEIEETKTDFKIVTKNTTDNEVVLLENNDAHSLTFDLPSNEIRCDTEVLKTQGGALHGNWLSKTQTLSELRTNFNNWTQAFVETVNEAYNPTRPDGPIDFGEDFFDVELGGTSIDTIRLKVTKDSLQTSFDSSNAQQNDRINALVALKETPIAALGNLTFSDNYAKFAVDAAQAFKSASDSLSDENVVQKMLVQQRQNMIGVSIDTELINLIRSQKAFQAAAKVITIIDELMEQSINLVRR